MDDPRNSLRTTKIEIGKDRFQIQTDLSDNELNEIIHFVSEKLNVYLGENAAADSKKRLILMALDITSEYFDVRRKYQSLKESDASAQKEIAVLNELLDREI